jgi:stage II sporulation protein M
MKLFGKQDDVAYLRELRPQFAASIALLAMGIALGIVGVLYHPASTDRMVQSFGQFAGIFRSLPKPFLALAVFINNAVKTLLVLVLGAFAGVVPVIFLLVNGVAIGVVLMLSFQTRGILITLLAIVPHGAIELPAILLGTSAGLLLGGLAVKRFRGPLERPMAWEVGRALRFYLRVVVPLLLVAAFVEAFVTSGLVGGG